MILTPLQKLPKNGEDWGKLIVANDLKKLPKVQNIAQSSHTEQDAVTVRTKNRQTQTLRQTEAKRKRFSTNSWARTSVT